MVLDEARTNAGRFLDAAEVRFDKGAVEPHVAAKLVSGLQWFCDISKHQKGRFGSAIEPNAGRSLTICVVHVNCVLSTTLYAPL